MGKKVLNIDTESFTQFTLEELREKGDRSFPPPSPTVLPAAYAQKLKEKDLSVEDLEQEISNAVSRKKRLITPCDISLSNAKRILWKAYARILNEQGKKFVAENGTNKNVETIQKLLCYFLGRASEHSLELKKGILLTGSVGSGKTLLLRLLKALVDIIDYSPRKFNIVGISDLDNNISIEGNFSPLKKYTKGIYCFDDIGVEHDTEILGASTMLVPRLILERYNLFQKIGLVTHATSNLTIAEMQQKYGERVGSRMREMFNEVVLIGIDKRKVE